MDSLEPFDMVSFEGSIPPTTQLLILASLLSHHTDTPVQTVLESPSLKIWQVLRQNVLFCQIHVVYSHFAMLCIHGIKYSVLIIKILSNLYSTCSNMKINVKSYD